MLSDREKQVAERLAKGKTYGEIAHDLGIAVPTVKAYVARARRKNNCGSRMELAVKYAVSKALAGSN